MLRLASEDNSVTHTFTPLPGGFMLSMQSVFYERNTQDRLRRNHQSIQNRINPRDVSGTYLQITVFFGVTRKNDRAEP